MPMASNVGKPLVAGEQKRSCQAQDIHIVSPTGRSAFIEKLLSVNHNFITTVKLLYLYHYII